MSQLIRKLALKTINNYRYVSTNSNINNELFQVKQQLEVNNYFVKRIFFINCFIGGVVAGEFTFNIMNMFIK
jgi:hypothetical protein